MNNCKKCGALIYDDFLFCGKCGEPVNKAAKHTGIIELRKNQKCRSRQNRARRSFPMNIAAASCWSALIALAVFLLFKTADFLKISSVNIKNVLYQLSLKYEYVKEGLSLSYIYPELRETLRYFLGWIYIAALAVLVAAGVFFAVCHITRSVLIKKGRANTVGLNKIQNTMITVFKTIALVFAAVILIVNISIILM